MKRLPHLLFLSALISGPLLASEPPSEKQRKGVAAAIDDLLINNPSNVVANTARAATKNATREAEVTAGASSVASPEFRAEPALLPTVYLDFDWSHIQDLTEFGPDGDRYGPTLGADWSLGNGFVVGGSLGYAAEYRTTTGVSTRSNDFIVSAYAAKNFGDWINIGATVVYDYQTRIIKSFGMRADGHNNTIGVSPFIGVAHSWNAFSFASTAVYIYQYNDLELASNNPVANPSESFGSHGYLHVNELNYALTDKLTASVLVNFNVELLQEESLYSTTLNVSEGFWMTWGAKLAWQENEHFGASLQFQADTFNKNFEVYTTTLGLNYQF